MTTKGAAAVSVAYDDAPVRRFHWRVGIASATGSFSDGYILGVSGIALATAADYMFISDLWQGLLASASLIGLFFGALLCGRLVDRFGRRPFYGPLMLVLAVVSVVQYWCEPDWTLFVLRLVLGFLLGGDYVSSKALLVEYVPTHWRGRALSMLGIAWAAGFASAYVVGLILQNIPDDGWRLILVSSALPGVLVYLLRRGIPESPRWLVKTGQVARARRVVTEKIGADVDLPHVTVTGSGAAARLRDLFAPGVRHRTVIACTSYAIAVMPNFALGTFSPRVLDMLGVEDSYTGALGYNMCVAIGALLGYFIIDRLSRRTMLFGGFLIGAALLVPLTFVANLPPLLAVGLFTLFALVIVACGNVVYVYPAELFGTQLRGTGVGLAVASSRLGSAVTTFLMPLVVGSYGIGLALGTCIVLLVVGAACGFRWGPETSARELADA